MRILIDSRVLSITDTLIDKSHKIHIFDMMHKPTMPFDFDSKSIEVQWVYSKAVDHDVDLVITADVDLAKKLNKCGVRTVSLI